MNLNQILRVSALAAVALGFLGISHADDCGKSTRVALPECVKKGYGSNNLSVVVINYCAFRVKVKVDRQGLFCGDWTWTLEGHGDRRDESGSCTIADVQCCGSSSVGGCDQTWGSLCDEQWRSSSASASCSGASFEYENGTKNCSIEAQCLNQHNLLVGATTVQHLDNVQHLKNCGGTLTRKSC